MTNTLVNLEKATPASTNYQGIIVGTPDALAVNVGGNVLPARWADPLVVAVGDTVLVEVSQSASGQAEAFVKFRLNATPRPGTGKVKTVPVSSPTITVTGTDLVDYTSYFISSYSPTVGDTVTLSWAASYPTVQGKVGATPAPPPAAPPPPTPVPPPPPPKVTGRSTYPASDSSTYWGPGGWESIAGGGNQVYQGTVYGTSAVVFGAWFYSGAASALSGRTINRIRFRIPPRRAVGNYNSSATLHLYAHTSRSRPGGDVSRVTGPYNITLPPGYAGGVIDLPLTFASALLSGGGIGIAGDPYIGLLGRLSRPDSGTLIIDWTR